MIVIIPLGGIGWRYKRNGYNKPKALIKVFGKPILFWLIESLNINKNVEGTTFALDIRINNPKIKYKITIISFLGADLN